MARHYLARDRVRFVGEPVAVVLTERPEPGRRRRRGGGGRLRAAARRWSTRRRRSTARPCCSPRSGTNLVGAFGRARAGDGPRGPTAARSWSASGSSTSGWPPARWRCGRRPRPGSTGACVMWCSTQNAHGARGSVGGPTGSTGRRAGDRARRGRRVRRQDRRPSRGRAAAVAGPPLRPAGALGRDPHREHARRWCRAAPRCRTSPSAAGATARSRRTACDHPGRGRLPDDRRLPADAHPDRWRPAPTPSRRSTLDARVVVTTTPPIGAYRGAGRPGGHGRHRAGRRPVRGRGGPGPGRGAPAQPAAPVRRAAHHAQRGDLRLRRLPRGARAGAGGRRLRRAAGRAGRRRRRGRPHRPRHRRRRLRGGHRRPVGRHRVRPRSRCGPGRDAAGDPDGVDVVVSTGSSPHGQGLDTALAMVVADALGVPIERDRACVHGDTDPCPRAPARWGRGRSSSAGRPCAARAVEVVERGPQRCRRAAGGGGRTTSCSTPTAGRFHVVGTPAVSRHLGRGGCGGGPPGRRPPGRRATTSHADPARRSRSGRTSPWSRSTPRPATSGWCGWWPATTPAGSSTRCSPRASVTAASPRARPRRCSRRSPSTATATR